LNGARHIINDSKQELLKVTPANKSEPSIDIT